MNAASQPDVTTTFGAYTPGAELCPTLKARGIPNPEDEVLQLVLSGKLVPWRGNSADAASLVCLGRMNTQDYAALKNVTAEPVWFANEDLLKLGLITPAVSRWRSAAEPLHAERLAQFENEQSQKREYVRGNDLAYWYASQRGAVTAIERAALHDEACNQLFGSLLDGGFIDLDRHPCASPLLLNEAGQSPMSPKDAQRFQGIHWAGAYDRDGKRILSTDLLRELMHDVWVPLGPVHNWCRRMNIGLPTWLSSDEAVQGIGVRPTVGGMVAHAQTERSPLADSRPKPTNRAVRQWFRDRVETWPDDQPPPTEADDWLAITQHFASRLSRNDFRLAREEETPAAWRKQGRRKPWGLAKLPAK